MSGAPSRRPSPPRVRALTGSQRLVAFATLLGVAAIVLWVLPLHNAARPTLLAAVPWWTLLLACIAAALVQVEVRIGRFSAPCSLAEIPLVAGLFLVDPHILLGCYAGGALTAHVVRRGVQPAKDYANLMLDSLCTGIAVWVFGALGPLTGVTAPRTVLALVAATAASVLLAGPVLLTAGTAVYQGRLPRTDTLSAVFSHILAATLDVTTALAVVALLGQSPTLLLVLVPPVLFLLLNQAAAHDARRRLERAEFLYRTSEALHAPQRVDERAAAMLGGVVSMFAVARAELLLVPEMREAALRFSVGGDASSASVVTSELTYAEQEALNALRNQRMMGGRQSRTANSALALVLAERGASAGTVVSLRGRDRPQGMLLLLDPLSGDASYGGSEVELLLTVAQLISAALESGQLAAALRTMTDEREAFTRRAFYDPLTQIANRSLFDETVTRALTRLGTSRKPIALLCIDLDGFADINHRHGHAVGDQVLSAVAARLRTQIRRFDMVARLGGDEFGILLDGMRRRDDVHIVAQRIVETLSEPITVPGGAVRVGGSVGIAVADDPASAPPHDELLRRADMAMYLAKRQGKSRYIVFDTGARTPVIATPASAASA